jgi:hypothetical protein
MRKSRKAKRTRGLGDQQAMAYVRVDGAPTAGMADTGTRRSVVDRRLAAKGTPVGAPGTYLIEGRRLRGHRVRVDIELIDAPSCKATVDAFVPDADADFRKGLVLGMDFLQGAGLRIDAETGEVYCPRALPRGVTELRGAKRSKARGE